MDRIFLATSILVGTVIGAGILSLPYAYNKAGIPLGLFSLVCAILIYVISSMVVIEMAKPGEEISDVIGRNLGRYGKVLVGITVIASTFGAAIAYNKGISDLLTFLLGINGWIPTFFIVVAFCILGYYGIKRIAKAESFLVISLLVFLIVISLYLLPKVKKDNLKGFNISYFFYAFGASIFAASGLSAVPDLLKIVSKRGALISILLAYIFVLGVYSLFSISFVGTYGNCIKEVAIENLSGVLYVFGAILAILSMGTSYLSLSYVMSRVLLKDFGFEKVKRGKLICVILSYFAPYLFALLGGFGFADIISFTGGVAMTTSGALLGIAYVRFSKRRLDKFVGFSLSGIYLTLLLMALEGLI